IAAGEPNGSRVPKTNTAGVRSRGRCAVRGAPGLPGGWSGYEKRRRAWATSGASAASMLACRPPYDSPPRTTLRAPSSRIACTAAWRPARSRAAPAGDGGPVARARRKGRSQRGTWKPPAAKARDIAPRSALRQFPPAPGGGARPAPPAPAGARRQPAAAGACRKPGMGGWPGGSALKDVKSVGFSRMVYRETERAYHAGSWARLPRGRPRSLISDEREAIQDEGRHAQGLSRRTSRDV